MLIQENNQLLGYLHLALGSVFGAGDVEAIKRHVIAFYSVNDEHLWSKIHSSMIRNESVHYCVY